MREGRKGTLFDLPCCALLSLGESCGENLGIDESALVNRYTPEGIGFLEMMHRLL